MRFLIPELAEAMSTLQISAVMAMLVWGMKSFDP